MSQYGDLYYAIDQREQAEEFWNDALDTIFQRLHSLNFAETIKITQNERNALIACTQLFKLAKFCYFDQLSKQQACL